MQRKVHQARKVAEAAELRSVVASSVASAVAAAMAAGPVKAYYDGGRYQ